MQSCPYFVNSRAEMADAYARMADVTYNTASFPALVRTLSSIMNQVPRPAILLGYKERDPAERNLWSMAKDVGIEFTKVDEIVGAGGVPMEIWIAT